MSWGNSNKYPQHMFYKEVDKSGCNLKTTKLLDCALLGACAVIRLNTAGHIYIENMGKTAHFRNLQEEKSSQILAQWIY